MQTNLSALRLYTMLVIMQHNFTDGSLILMRHTWTGIKNIIFSFVCRRCYWYQWYIQCESKKIPPTVFLKFFPKRLGIFNQFFTHLLQVPLYARLQIFIQLSPTLTKLCHTKRDYWLPNEFLHFTRSLSSKFVYWANDVTVDVVSYPTCSFTL